TSSAEWRRRRRSCESKAGTKASTTRARAVAGRPDFRREKKESGAISHAGFFLSYRQSSSDVNLSRRVERSGNAAARIDAAFIVRCRRSSRRTSRTTGGGADHRCLGAPPQNLAGNGADRRAADDFLHV